MSEADAHCGCPPAQHYIGGRFVDAASGGSFDVINPATEEVVTTAARGDAADISVAVRAAKEAFAGGRLVPREAVPQAENPVQGGGPDRGKIDGDHAAADVGDGRSPLARTWAESPIR